MNIAASFARNRAIVFAFVSCAVLFVATSVYSHGFASSSNIRALLTQASLVGLVALGQTMVVIGGGIDLSIPWVLNGSAVVTTTWADGHNGRLAWVVPVVLMLGALIGTANGIGVTVFRVPPIIMTLGMLAMVQGGLLAYTAGGGGQLAPTGLDRLATEGYGPVTRLTGIWFLCIVLATVVLTWTVFGRRLYAVGTGRLAAMFSGVNERTVITGTYAISGVTSAAAGVLLAGYVQQSYLGMGDPYLFASVAAVAIGGASILGGSGHYIGTVAGAMTLTVLTGMLPILGFQPAVLDIVYGVVILAAIGMASISSRDRR
jgi:ribose transport system permease protein